VNAGGLQGLQIDSRLYKTGGAGETDKKGGRDFVGNSRFWLGGGKCHALLPEHDNSGVFLDRTSLWEERKRVRKLKGQTGQSSTEKKEKGGEIDIQNRLSQFQKADRTEKPHKKNRE